MSAEKKVHLVGVPCGAGGLKYFARLAIVL